MSEDESERKRRTAQRTDAEIAALFARLELSEAERAFAEEHGPIVFREIVAGRKEAVKTHGTPLRPVAISAVFAYAMIAAEAIAKERGHH